DRTRAEADTAATPRAARRRLDMGMLPFHRIEAGSRGRVQCRARRGRWAGRRAGVAARRPSGPAPGDWCYSEALIAEVRSAMEESAASVVLTSVSVALLWPAAEPRPNSRFTSQLALFGMMPQPVAPGTE